MESALVEKETQIKQVQSRVRVKLIGKSPSPFNDVFRGIVSFQIKLQKTAVGSTANEKVL
jgi:hypothetical protein